ncbi:MAG TPA: hypothetical protein VFO96_03425 [Gemmatimonadales bacterium]|nr:hypothetical protein [Gemmatimonadales bacterium]
MPRRLAALLFVALSVSPGALRAQASPYIPTDDPAMPIIEHLIARGAISDPSPMMRPMLRGDLVRALHEAARQPGTAGPVQALLERFDVDTAGPWWEAGGRVGAEAYSTPRQDLFHPVGDASANPYAEARIAAGFANVVAVSRVAVEPRLTDDPDWTGRRNVDLASRLAEGYLSAQFRYVRITYGQVPQNWGPAGLPGIPLSDYGYERQGLTFELGNRTVRLSALATDLNDGVDSSDQTAHRYYFVHRLNVRVAKQLDVAAWEANVLSGVDREFETRYRNPLSVSYLANTIGLGDRGNVMLGADATWRVRPALRLEGQLGVDDFWYQNRQNNRDRYLFTLTAAGPLGDALSWRAMYTEVSSLALRAFNPADNFTDAGVGLGRNFSDYDQLSLRVNVPLRSRWLVTPELALFRQGEGDINTPYPVGAQRQSTPALFIGTMERTWRAGVLVSGEEGPLQLTGDVGLHHVTSAGHVEGETETKLVFRVRGTIGLGWGGRIAED